MRMTGLDFMNCARFFREAEWYDHMEDALFQAVELFAESPDREAFAEEGVRILTEASAARAETLALAHTSREELQEAAAQLRELGNSAK